MFNRIGSGGSKTPDTDLLVEIRNAVKEEIAAVERGNREIVKTLGASNFLLNKILGAATFGGGGGGGGGGSSGGGGGTGGSGGEPFDPKNKHPQLENILDALLVIRTELAQVLGRQAAGDADGAGGGSGSGGFAEMENVKKSFDVFEKSMTSINETALLPFYGAIIEANYNLRTFSDRLLQFGKNIASMSHIEGYIAEMFENIRVTNSTGMLNFWDVATNDIQRMFKDSSDSLTNTLELVRKRAEEGMSPMLLTGRRILDFSEAMVKTRQNVRAEGFAFDERMNFKVMNDVLLDLYESQRSRGIKEDITSSVTARNFRQQLAFYDVIAQNTGKTVDELVKQNADIRSKIDGFVADRQIDPMLGQGLEQTYTLLKSLGQTELADIVSGIASAGGSMELYRSQNPDKSQVITSRGLDGFFNQLVSQARMGSIDPVTRAEMLRDMVTNAYMQTGNRSAGLVYAANKDDQITNAIAQMGKIGEGFEQLKESNEKGIMSLVRQAYEYVTNTIPLKFIASVGANVTALGANTLALWNATRVLKGQKALIPSIVELLTAKKFGAGAAAATTTASTVAGTAAAGAAGGATGFIGRWLPRLLKGGALALGSMTGVGLLITGAITIISYLPEIISGIKSLFGVTSDSTTKSKANSTGIGSPQYMQNQVMKQTELLSDIKSILEDANDIHKVIQMNTTPSNALASVNTASLFSKLWG